MPIPASTPSTPSTRAARVRLAVVGTAVAGVLALALHPAGAAGAAARPTSPVPAAAPADGPGAGSVDESLPHRHVLDPRTGGVISLAGAAGAMRGAAGLGPVHADPLPPGVSLTDPTDTASLLRRAALEQPAADAAPLTAGDTAPVGTPGIRTLREHVLPSCTGTGTDGHRVQVLYLHEAGTPSRLAAVLPVLRNQVADVDDVFALSAAQTGGTRRVRWVHDADCLPVVKAVTVPVGALGPDFWATVRALGDLGYDDPARKYLTFADADELCGIGTVMSDSRPTGNANDGGTAAYARVDTSCWSTGHSVAAHELTHTLGGVLAGAPHATENGHCYDESDLMCYDDGSGVPMQQVCASAQEQLLDCHHDDYFSTAPPAGSFLATSWNTARSSFLDDLAGPDVHLTASTTSARTGDGVSFSASSSRSVGWDWTSSSTTCRLTPTAARAVLVCPSTVTGRVTVTARGTEAGTGASGSAVSTVTLTRADAPTAAVSAPATAGAGTPFTVAVRATGTAPYTYAWTVAGCTAAAPTEASTTVLCPAGAPTQARQVSVLVRQADGQAVRAATTVTVTGDVPAGEVVPPVASSWTPTLVRAGGALSAVLSGAGGELLAGRRVDLEVRWQGAGTWHRYAGGATTSAGEARLAPPRARAGSWRFTWAGDDGHLSSTSAAVHLSVPTRLAITVPARRRLVGTLTSTAGAPVPGAVVLLQRRLGTATAWSTVVRLRTGSTGRVTRSVRPPRPASFRFVFSADGVHLGATSSVRAVR